MNSSSQRRNSRPSVACTRVSTTQASGEANSAFSSLAAIVKIMIEPPRRQNSSKTRRYRSDGCFALEEPEEFRNLAPHFLNASWRRGGSLIFLAARQVHEHVLQAGLRGRELEQSPITRRRRLHQRVGRVGARGGLHAKQRRLDLRHRRRAGNGLELGERRRAAQPDQHGGAALELLEPG